MSSQQDDVLIPSGTRVLRLPGITYIRAPVAGSGGGSRPANGSTTMHPIQPTKSQPQRANAKESAGRHELGGVTVVQAERIAATYGLPAAMPASPVRANPNAALVDLARRHGNTIAGARASHIRSLALHGPGDRPDPLRREERNSADKYVLPFSLSSRFAGIDQGVDYAPRSPVRAIAPGRVYHVSPPGSFATPMGTGQAVYERLDAPITVHGRKYYAIYYAEQRPLVRVGQHVAAGKPVMESGPDELGFASPDTGHPRPQGRLIVVQATPQHGRYTEPTTEGRDFLAFLQLTARHP